MENKEYLEIRRIDGLGNGTCNFCDRGHWNGIRMDYPYNHIFMVGGRSISVRFCPECFADLKGIDINEIADIKTEPPEHPPVITRYMNEPKFKALADVIISHIKHGNIEPEDFVDAAYMAYLYLDLEQERFRRELYGGGQ